MPYLPTIPGSRGDEGDARVSVEFDGGGSGAARGTRRSGRWAKPPTRGWWKTLITRVGDADVTGDAERVEILTDFLGALSHLELVCGMRRRRSGRQRRVASRCARLDVVGDDGSVTSTGKKSHDGRSRYRDVHARGDDPSTVATTPSGEGAREHSRAIAHL